LTGGQKNKYKNNQKLFATHFDTLFYG
jgi:hypothetical protein